MVWSLVWASVTCERRREALGSSIAVDAISWRCRFRPLNHSNTRRHLAGALYAYLFLDDFVLLSPVYTLLFADAGLSVWQIRPAITRTAGRSHTACCCPTGWTGLRCRLCRRDARMTPWTCPSCRRCRRCCPNRLRRSRRTTPTDAPHAPLAAQRSPAAQP